MTTVTTIVLDGITDRPEYGIYWSQQHITVGSGDPNEKLALQLTGSWTLHSLTLDASVLSISDLSTAGGIRILTLDVFGGQPIAIETTTSVISHILNYDASTSLSLSQYADYILLSPGDDIVEILHGGADAINLGNGNNQLETVGTSSGDYESTGFVNYLRAGSGDDIFKIGGGGANYVDLGRGTNSITTTDGWVRSIRSGDGADTILIGSGYQGPFDDQLYAASVVNAGDGANHITTTSGWVGTVLSGGGDDIILIGSGGAEQVNASGGNNYIETTDRWVGYIDANHGDDIVKIGSGGAQTVHVENGDNVVTTVGHVGSVSAYSGEDVFNIGEGGADQVNAGEGDNVIRSVGWVGSVVTYGGNDIIHIGAGGADQVHAGGGNNTITIDGWTGSIQTWGGADVITINGTIQWSSTITVSMGNGADIFVFKPQANQYTSVIVDGGYDQAVDRVDLSAFSNNLVISLENSAGWQNTSQGWVTLLGIDEVVGGSGNDILTGSGQGSTSNNYLDGAGGDDSLIGLADADHLNGGTGDDSLDGGLDNDVLIGGAGDDVLFGGAGIDTAEFSGNYSEYSIVYSTDLVVVQDTRLGADGTDETTGLEFLKFQDQTVSVPIGRIRILSQLEQTTVSGSNLTADDVLNSATQFFWSSDVGGNDHIYEVVLTAGLTWEQATANANGLSVGGVSGHLFTATSATEQALVESKILSLNGNAYYTTEPAHFWTGGYYADGKWRWSTGPESGQEVVFTDWFNYAGAGFIEAEQFLEENVISVNMFDRYDINGSWYSISPQFEGCAGYIVEYSSGGAVEVTSPAVEAVAADFVVGQTLYADYELLTDSNGIYNVAWQWERSFDGGESWSAISGAINATYTLSVGDETGMIRVVATYSDSQGISKTFASGASTVIPAVNDAPTGIYLSNSSVDENNEVGAIVATLSASDPDAVGSGLAGPFTYTLIAGSGDTDNSLFTIVGDQLKLMSSANFEVRDFYSLRIQVTDVGGLSYEVTKTISVADVGEAPVITSGGQSNAVTVLIAENVTAVTTVSAVDEDANTTLTYSIAGGLDASLVQINSQTGALSFVNAPDFEAPADAGGNNVYNVVVQVSDGILTDEQAISISVTDAVEAQSGFNIVELGRTGDTVTFGLVVNGGADPGGDGLGAFDFTLDYDPASISVNADSLVFVDGITGIAGGHNAQGGALQIGGFATNPASLFSAFQTPILQFDATILNRELPIQLSAVDILFDDRAVGDSNAVFDYSTNEVTTIVTTRSGVLMEGVDVSSLLIGQGEGMFVRAKSLGNGDVEFELVANPSVSTGALDFTIKEDSISNFSLGTALTGWTSQINQELPGVISVSAIGAANGSLNLSPGSEVVLATFTASGAVDLLVTDGMLGSLAQSDIRATLDADTTAGGGAVVQRFENGLELYVYADADFSNVRPTRAVTSQDALEALRLSVGMSTTSGDQDAFTFMSADFNRNGRVNSQDALEILRFAVGAQGALDADWIFVDTHDDYSGINRNNVLYDEGVTIDSLTDDVTVYLTAILRGDVNDSISGMLVI